MGVAEPIALMYGFMYEFADGQDFTDVFVPWCTWVTIWTSIFLFIFSITGAPPAPVCMHARHLALPGDAPAASASAPTAARTHLWLRLSARAPHGHPIAWHAEPGTRTKLSARVRARRAERVHGTECARVRMQG